MLCDTSQRYMKKPRGEKLTILIYGGFGFGKTSAALMFQFKLSIA